MAGNEKSGRDDIFTIIRDAYTKSDPKLSIYEIGLDIKLIEILERWIFIDQLRSRDYPKKNTKEILNIYKRKYKLSERQFFDDKKNCERLFGPMVVINKEYEKRLAIDAYQTLFNLAVAKNDFKSAVKALENKIALLGIFDKNDYESKEGGSKSYIMQTNFILDGKLIEKRQIDISNLQQYDFKQLREISAAIDVPEANMELMEAEIDKLHE